MVIHCGVSSTDQRSEAIFRSLREQGRFSVEGGCGRPFDLSNPLQQALMYRCVECARWLCRPCILAHFSETSDDKMPFRSTGGQGREGEGRDGSR